MYGSPLRSVGPLTRPGGPGLVFAVEQAVDHGFVGSGGGADHAVDVHVDQASGEVEPLKFAGGFQARQLGEGRGGAAGALGEDRIAGGERIFLGGLGGEKGKCLLPGGCLPNLATVRRAEMRNVARFYGARLIHWTLPDGAGRPDGSAPTWDTARGGHRALIATIGHEIDAAGADVVLTLDPFHGSTCHADHRAVGSLVSEAIQAASSHPTLFFLETRWEVKTSPLVLSSRPAAPLTAGAFAFDANLSRGTPPRPAWNALVDDASRHPSQFDQEWLRALGRVPVARRAIYLAPADLLLSSPDALTCR